MHIKGEPLSEKELEKIKEEHIREFILKTIKECIDVTFPQKFILKQTDLYDIFPFQKTKVQQIIKSGQLPLVKIGKDYITTYKILEEWISDHIGEEIFY